MKIAILSDSSCTRNKFKNNKDFYYVPLLIGLSDGTQIKDDDTLLQDEFYTYLEKDNLKTSLTPPGIMMEKFDELLESYDQVIVLLLSKGLSGQFNSARLIATEDKYKDKIFVVDTNGVSMVLDHEIEEAFKLVAEGKEGSEIVEFINNMNDKFTTFIIPKSLNQLVRGGRISKSAAALAKILKINPILKYDGEIDKESKTRTFKKAVNEALNLIKERRNGAKFVDISYSRASQETIDMVKELVERNKLHLRSFDELSNVITAHTGKETFAIAAWEERGE